MVFGNKGDRSGTGVVFTRNPSTGQKEIYGEYLQNAQGEDVVAGIRTPQPVEVLGREMPEAYEQLLDALRRLEEHYRDVQDTEFTVEDGALYMLQTRAAKRTAAAALKAAVDMVEEELISRDEAVARIDPATLDQLLHPRIDTASAPEPVAKGLNASPGAASGGIVFDADTAEEKAKGGPVILVRQETTPDDIHGMIAAQGILTVHGGMTSHAAVVARGMGKPCVAGCEGLTLGGGTATLAGRELREGDVITIDGGTGAVYIGRIELVPPQLNDDFQTVLGWADEIRRLRVRANADTPPDAARAREFGAQGIGLCRTEHMFFGEERLPVMQEMILAVDLKGRRAALERLLPFQQSDFEGIFEAMSGLPVTIRLLDPPLHEFLPPEEQATDEAMRARIRSLHETNPMLGLRGCRLGLVYPEIYEMQIRAIARAALAVEARLGEAPLVEIMHPLVGFAGGAAPPARADRARLGRGGACPRAHRRHDDRASARLYPGRRDRRSGPVLLVRHERPDPDDARGLARRRRGQVPGALPLRRRDRAQPVRGARRRRRRRADADRGRAGEGSEPLDQARHLRRARRRAPLDRLLPLPRSRLRQLLALPGAGCAPRSSAGRAGRGWRRLVRRRRRLGSFRRNRRWRRPAPTRLACGVGRASD